MSALANSGSTSQPTRSSATRDGQAENAPLVAVIIPVYRQPQFLAESVASALAQTLAVPYGIVIVDDGCPLPETAALGLSFALADERVRYLRTPNRGLSAARNAGIACALATWPGLQALYLLDADNRLTPRTLERGYAALVADPGASWIYPQLNKFGLTWSGHVACAATPLHLLFAGSFMEASSLIHRRVFEAGVRYDETMRDGYEDWEFWLQAFRRGFRGACLPEMGLDYRYRPESMVRSASRQRPVLLNALRQRHPELYRARALLEFEQAYHPRYARVRGDTVESFTDPTGSITREQPSDLTARLWQTLSEPERTRLPPYLLWADPSAFDALSRAKVIQGALRRLEAAADAETGLAALVLPTAILPDSDAIETAAGEVALILVRTEVFARAVTEPCKRKESGFEADLARAPRTRMAAPKYGMEPIRSPITVFEEASETWRACQSEGSKWELPTRWHWQTRTLADSRELVEALRAEIGGAPLSNVARGAQRRPFCLVADRDPHALVDAAEWLLGAKPPNVDLCLTLCGEPDSTLVEGDERVASLEILQLPEVAPSDFRYLGDPFELPAPGAAEWREVRGCLAGYAAIMVGMPRLFPLLAEWRAGGTRTLVYQPAGGVHRADHRLILAFEHVIDHVLVATEAEARWLGARGFPQEKILVRDGGPCRVEIFAETHSLGEVV
ncbi:glycosyltransferase family 2 protein [Methylobacterium sp. E-016]|uniref:glycosyltransferase family 2 protein n=1 Tax=Methylobacterium sp. E-016 TaxID=2836556 RepID=UPI001FBBC4ED|nr:glycosyltransferase family A protein [Methylobacterium sp. E-016]MCJ2074444.1 glycosyltransferase family 2 protein [Methylobacterium sp. E-016]